MRAYIISGFLMIVFFVVGFYCGVQGEKKLAEEAVFRAYHQGRHQAITEMKANRFEFQKR